MYIYIYINGAATLTRLLRTIDRAAIPTEALVPFGCFIMTIFLQSLTVHIRYYNSDLQCGNRIFVEFQLRVVHKSGIFLFNLFLCSYVTLFEMTSLGERRIIIKMMMMMMIIIIIIINYLRPPKRPGSAKPEININK